METEELKYIYQTAYNFLLKQKGITESDLKKHLIVESQKPNDLSIIYKRFCESAQNKQMSNKVIGYSIGGIQYLSTVLHDFDPHKVANEYSRTDSMKLLEKIKNVLKPKGQIRITSRSIWPLFCQSVIDSAYFLKQFDTADMFYKWADIFVGDQRAKPALPLMISIEISGIGFPLACDILKELGYMEYGKPDVHLKSIFKALDIIDSKIKSGINQDYETLKSIDSIAKANNVTSYAVDKIFWLIGSGNFYLTGQKIGKQKEKFLSQFKSYNK